MDDAVEQQIRARAERAIAAHVFPGCVVGLIRVPCPSEAVGEGGNKQIVIPVGTLDGTSPVSENTIYDVASITKSIPLASLALTLIAEGKLSLIDRATKYLPELQNHHDATIEDLLRYRVTGLRLSQLHLKTFEEIRTHVFEHGFDAPALSRRSLGEGGRGWGAYTNLPAFLLGIVIERITGEILSALAHRYFFEPLGMKDTSFFPEVPDTSISADRQILMCLHDNIAPTEIVDGKEIRGIVHDESARVFARARRAVGHAGLFSTAQDLRTFLEALLVGKLPAVVAGAEQGLGWSIDEPWRRGRYSSKMFSKTGFTGCLVAADAEKGIGLVILSNRTYPRRPPDNSAINIFRKDIADIVFG